VPSAADHIARAIEAAGGAVRFDAFMNMALYGPEGFYNSGGRAGRRGDFITSPEVGPLFGAVLARALDAWWVEMGSPDDFRVF
jgi:SAM-dependent MidA family methyltransferase